MDTGLIVLLCIVGIIGVIICIPLLLLPTIIAFKRNHKNKVAILVVNLLVPTVGWIIALIWSLTND